MLGIRGWHCRCEPHYTIKKSFTVSCSRCGSDQAVYLEKLPVADVFGLKERNDHMEVVIIYLYY